MADSNIWDWLAPSLATIGGTALVGSVNSRAAKRAGDAALEGARITAAGNDRAIATLNQVRTEAQPGTTYLRQVVADPTVLTPQQQVALDDERRALTSTMRGNSFAGSGRAGAALIKRSDSDFVNNALEANRTRAMGAATTLNGNAVGAASGVAGVESNTGKALGDATAKSGLYGANADLATGNVMGKAIGDIGSVIANQQRTSRYGDRLAGIEKSLNLNGARPSSYGGDNADYSPSRTSFAYTG